MRGNKNSFERYLVSSQRFPAPLSFSLYRANNWNVLEPPPGVRPETLFNFTRDITRANEGLITLQRSFRLASWLVIWYWTLYNFWVSLIFYVYTSQNASAKIKKHWVNHTVRYNRRFLMILTHRTVATKKNWDNHSVRYIHRFLINITHRMDPQKSLAEPYRALYSSIFYE